MQLGLTDSAGAIVFPFPLSPAAALLAI